MTLVDTFASEYGWTVDEILDTTIARLRKCLDSIKARQKNEFRKQVALTEWMTKVIATSIFGAQGGEGSAKAQDGILGMHFPWEGSPKEEAKQDFDPDDLSYLETGDLSAAEKNVGKRIANLRL